MEIDEVTAAIDINTKKAKPTAKPVVPIELNKAGST